MQAHHSHVCRHLAGGAGAARCAGAMSGQNATSGRMKGTSGRMKGTSGRMKGTSGRMKGTSGQIEGTSGRMKGTSGRMKGTSGRIEGTTVRTSRLSSSSSVRVVCGGLIRAGAPLYRKRPSERPEGRRPVVTNAVLIQTGGPAVDWGIFLGSVVALQVVPGLFRFLHSRQHCSKLENVGFDPAQVYIMLMGLGSEDKAKLAAAARARSGDFSASIWQALAWPLQSSIFAIAVARVLRVTGLTHTIMGAIMGLKGWCFVSCLHLPEVVFVISAGLFLIRYNNSVADRIAAAAKDVGPFPSEMGTVNVIHNISNLVLSALTFVATLDMMQIDISMALGTLGFTGIALGFASKEVAANVIAGVQLLVQQPFKTGDVVDGGKLFSPGLILEIGITRSRVLDLGGPVRCPLNVPNADLMSATVRNISLAQHRKLNTTFGVKVSSMKDLKTVLQEITAYLESHPKVDAAVPGGFPTATLSDFTLASIVINISCFLHMCNPSEFNLVKQEILLSIGEMLETNKGVTIAFPEDVSGLFDLQPTVTAS